MWAWLGDFVFALAVGVPIIVCAAACLDLPTVVDPVRISRSGPPLVHPPYFGSAWLDHEEPAGPFDLGAAHLAWQQHRDCDCPRKGAAVRVLVAAGHIAPDRSHWL
ncbi:hypothetical protein ACPESR_25335 [Nocardia testacea]|uniref:hypothetical protein n=1 Tax=Nocardia testacea TaxID=248551 RepID=UPI003C2FD051